MRPRTALPITLLFVTSLFASLPSSKKSAVNLPMISQGEGPTFFLDFSNFLGEEDQTFVEFYVQVAYKELQFFRHKGKFRAGVPSLVS